MKNHFNFISNFVPTLIEITLHNFSSGNYPDCKCNDEKSQYDKIENACLECPVNKSEGFYPNCTCNNGLYSIKKGVCVECPANSTGLLL